MTAKSTAGWAVALPIIFSFGSVLCSAVRADPLEFSQTPVSDVVARLDRTFGISIVINGSNSPSTPVSLDVDDTSRSDARLDAINQLANSLGDDFQKSFVLSRVADGTPIPSVRIDTNASITFPDDTVNAVSAIQRIASLDESYLHMSDSVSGTVNLSDDELSIQDAANQIAQQTHTDWHAIYTLTPRSQTQSLHGKVVDRTNEGQAILELPFSMYFPPTPKPQPEASVDSTPATGAKTATSSTQAQSSTTESPYTYQYDGGYGSPYGYGSTYQNSLPQPTGPLQLGAGTYFMGASGALPLLTGVNGN